MWTEVGAAMVTMVAAVGLLGCALQAPGAPVIRDEVHIASSTSEPRAEGLLRAGAGHEPW